MKLNILIKAIIIILLFQLFFIPTVSRAENVGDIVTQGDEFVSRGEILIDQSKLKQSMSFIFNVLLAIGTILTVFVGGYLGIKYMISSVEEKAEIKKTILPFATGSIIIFGAYGIWKIVITVLDSIT